MTCKETISKCIVDFLEKEHNLDGLPEVDTNVLASEILAALIEKSDLVAMSVMIDEKLDLLCCPAPSEVIQTRRKGTKIIFHAPATSIKDFHLLAYRIRASDFSKIKPGKE